LVALKWRVVRLLLLAVALLVVQTGAILHAYGHRDLARQEGAAGSEQCLYCKASAPLLGAVGAPTPLSLLLPLATLLLVPFASAPLPRAFRHPAFRSRAPPQQP
jgi:hypothetical protein